MIGTIRSGCSTDLQERTCRRGPAIPPRPRRDRSPPTTPEGPRPPPPRTREPRTPPPDIPPSNGDKLVCSREGRGRARSPRARRWDDGTPESREETGPPGPRSPGTPRKGNGPVPEGREETPRTKGRFGAPPRRRDPPFRPRKARLDFQGPSDPLRTLLNREALFRRPGPNAARGDFRPMDTVSKKRELFPGGRPASPRGPRFRRTPDPSAGPLTGFPFVASDAPTTPPPKGKRAPIVPILKVNF